MNELIIERPKLQTIYQKYGSATLTAFFWILWIYIWTPLITLGCWFFGIEFIYTEIFTYTSFKYFIDDIRQYFVAISILCAGLIFWSIYNFLRFRKSTRYKESPAVSLEETSNYSDIKKDLLATYQKNRVLSVQFDEQNKLADIHEGELWIWRAESRKNPAYTRI